MIDNKLFIIVTEIVPYLGHDKHLKTKYWFITWDCLDDGSAIQWESHPKEDKKIKYY